MTETTAAAEAYLPKLNETEEENCSHRLFLLLPGRYMQASLDNYYLDTCRKQKLQRKCVNYFTANLDTALFVLDIYFYMKLGPIKNGLIYKVNSIYKYIYNTVLYRTILRVNGILCKYIMRTNP